MNIRKDFKEEKPRFARRIAWRIVNATLFRCFGGSICWPARRALLRMFGAQIDSEAYIYARCRIFAPWNLKVGRSLIGPRTELYCKDLISIGDHSVISQGTVICTASHDSSSLALPLKTAPVTIGNDVWIAAEAFIAPATTIGDRAVVSARAALFSDVDPDTIVSGNPATILRKRTITDPQPNLSGKQRGASLK